MDRVMLQLRSQNLPHLNVTKTVGETSGRRPAGTQLSTLDPTLMRIAELECQLPQLREQSEQERMLTEPNAFGMLNPTHTHIAEASDSRSGVIN